MWASDLALAALKATPIGLPHSGEPTACSHCGKPIHAGDLCSPVSVGQFFSDTRDLAEFSGIACGGCLVLRTKKAMNGLSYAVLTPDGIYPIAKFAHKAWLFLEPPEPPFIAVHTSATMQHLVWRTPVTLSKELIYLRRGADLFTLRPALIKRAVAAAQAIQQRRLANDPKAMLSPYAAMDLKLRDASHGKLSPKALAVMEADETDLFYRLSPGEVWALGHLLIKTPPVPEKPEPITISLSLNEE